MSKGGGEATKRMNERYSRYSGAHHLFSSTLTIIVCPLSEWPQAAKKEGGWSTQEYLIKTNVECYISSFSFISFRSSYLVG